jgi:oligoendopeptidase F
MANTNGTNGQANPDSNGATGAAPEGTEGESGSTVLTTGNGPDTGAESFFDPSSIQDKPELLTAYKQMQSAWTKKLQGVKAHQQKIDAYDRFSSDPVNTIKQIAAQYGLNVIQPGDAAPEQEFKSWDDVKQHFFKEFKKEMQPVFNEVNNLKKQNVETYLDSHYSDWRTYEDAMMETLRDHPSLVRDPDKLYRISVPNEVWESRATKAAMAKLKSAGANAQISGNNSTTRQTSQEPTGPLTFDQAVEVAKKRLAAKGIRGVAG